MQTKQTTIFHSNEFILILVVRLVDSAERKTLIRKDYKINNYKNGNYA